LQVADGVFDAHILDAPLAERLLTCASVGGEPDEIGEVAIAILYSIARKARRY
jgi:hypothetical protein